MTKKQFESMLDRVSAYREQVEELHIKREDYYADRSEKWQEEKGDEYEEKTYILDELMDALTEAEDKIQEYLDAE